ncbi:SE1561 family protein [Halobacillus rhizosphaerae]
MPQQEKLTDLKTRLSEFMNKLDQMNPEETSVEDIDRLILMLEDLERKMD